MHSRFLPRLVRPSSATALRHCYIAACNSPLSADGWYHLAHQTGPTAAWCTTIEWLVMNCRIVVRAVARAIAIAELILGPVCRVLGCAPSLSMVSGSMCSVRTHEFNRLLCVAFLTLVCALNFLAAMRWPVLQPRSVAGVLKSLMVVLSLMVALSLMVVLFLIVVPFAVFAWFLGVTQTSIEAQWVPVALTLSILWRWGDLLATKWTAAL